MNQKSAIQILFDFLSTRTPVEELPLADVIFVFGGNSQKIAEHAAMVYARGLAPRVLLSGGAGSRTILAKGYHSEAAGFAKTMVDLGVPRDVIILEEKATNTLENVTFGIEALSRHGAVFSGIIAVSTPPLLTRAQATLRRHLPRARIVGSTFDSPISDWNSPYRIARMRGELDRLKKYAERGDIVSVEIPHEVNEAYLVLRTFVSI